MFIQIRSGLTSAGTALSVISLASTVHAETLVSNTFDADSYVFIGTNNAFSPEVTVGVDLSPTDVYHFNFGVIEFDDLSAFTSAGNKHLRFEIEAFSSTEVIGGFPVTTLSPTGEATLKIIALEASYNDYLASPDKAGWFDAYVGGAAAAATGSFAATGIYDLDVTDVVNGWISNPTTNHGFALILTEGDPIELGANEGGNGIQLSDTPLITTLPGDADSDGDIDDTDLGIAIANFTGPGGLGKTLAQGDTDADGDVDDTDLGVTIAGFTGPNAPAAVPEPGIGGLLALGGLCVLRRRRR